MNNKSNFRPNWASPPGATIADILNQKDLSTADFADCINKPADFANDLIAGREALSIEIARTLERALGAPFTFWLTREAQYREDSARQEKRKGSEIPRDWLSELPVGDMIKYGWINPKSRSIIDRAEACLNFFAVPDIPSWREEYSNIQNVVAFRTSFAFDSYPGAVASWLRQGEIEAASIDCREWDSEGFRKALPEIRSLTRKRKPDRFMPLLKTLCAEYGVAVAIVRAPTGCRASGATRFLSQTKALLFLSFRYRTDDHFWFTFFHEAGHLLLHDKKAIFLEGAELVSTHEEEEANQFAADVLIPEEFHTEMRNLDTNYRAIMKFARRVGVSPGIIVGQLQHRGCIKRNQLNYLKSRISWLDKGQV